MLTQITDAIRRQYATMCWMAYVILKSRNATLVTYVNICAFKQTWLVMMVHNYVIFLK